MARRLGSRRRAPTSGPFIGREVEQERLRETFRQLAAYRDRSDDDLPEALTYAQVFLIRGEGGMGKSTLLRRFKELAAENSEGANAQAVLIDIEQHTKGMAVRSPEQLMDIIHDALCEQGFEKQLKPYREARSLRHTAVAKATSAREQFRGLGELGGRAVELLSAGIFDKDIASEGIHSGAEGLAALRDFIKRKLSADEWRLAEKPWAITDDWMDALNACATPRQPLLILLDTYELADSCDRWFRQCVLPQTGLRLLWGVAGRENKAFVSDYRNDKALAAVDPSVIVDINMHEFVRSEIISYLNSQGIAEPDAQLVSSLETLTRGVPLALKGWVNLHEKGVALPSINPAAPTTRRQIVQLLTERFLQYCADDKDLPAAERQQRQRTREQIITLMLLRQTDADMLAAAWGCAAEEAERILQALDDRFSFIFADPLTKQPHALVREVIREHTRSDPQPPVEVRRSIERLVAHQRQRLRQREQQIASPAAQPARALSAAERQQLEQELATLRENVNILSLQITQHLESNAPVQKITERNKSQTRIAEIERQLQPAEPEAAPLRRPLWDDETWRERTLDLLNMLCWRDKTGEQPLRLMLPLFVEALAFHDDTAVSLVETAAEFAENWPHRFRETITVLLPGCVEGSWTTTNEELKAILEHLEPAQAHWTLNPLHQAILLLKRSELALSTQRDDPRIARSYVEQADHLLSSDGGELTELLSDVYQQIGGEYLWPNNRSHAVKAPEALQLLERAVALNAKNQSAWYNVGVIYNNLQRYDDAIAAYHAAIDRDLTIAAPHNGLGNVYYSLCRYDKAIAAFQSAIDRDPTFAAPHNGLGNVYADLQRYDDAIAAFQSAIDRDPSYAYPHNGLGNVYYSLCRYDDAIAAFQSAIDRDASYASPHNGLGTVYADLQRYDEAIAAYHTAIDRDPTFAAPHHGLGTVYADLQRYDEAITAYQSAIDRDPIFAAPHNGLGNIYSLLGKLESARDAYRQVVELDPTIYPALLGLASLERQLGNSERAQELIEQARQHIPADDHYNRACLECIAGNYDEALGLLRTALSERQVPLDWAKQDPDFSALHDDPRFIALIEEMAARDTGGS